MAYDIDLKYEAVEFKFETQEERDNIYNVYYSIFGKYEGSGIGLLLVRCMSDDEKTSYLFLGNNSIYNSYKIWLLNK